MGCCIESATKKCVQNLHFLLVHKIFHLSLQIKIWGTKPGEPLIWEAAIELSSYCKIRGGRA